MQIAVPDANKFSSIIYSHVPLREGMLADVQSVRLRMLTSKTTQISPLNLSVCSLISLFIVLSSSSKSNWDLTPGTWVSGSACIPDRRRLACCEATELVSSCSGTPLMSQPAWRGKIHRISRIGAENDLY